MRLRAVGGCAVVAFALAVFPHSAAGSDDGLILHANGWYRGKADISEGQIKCEIPTVDSAIADGAFSMGLWNTHGTQTLQFPDPNNPFGNPCGGWLQLRNNLLMLGQTVQRIVIQGSIPGTRSVWHLVPTRRSFPTACRTRRRMTIHAGVRLEPAASTDSVSNSGAPNVAFVQLLPLVANDLIECLHSQYGDVPTELLSSLSLVLRATVYTVDDLGDRHRSNPVSYTLNLRHTCGNGRVDDGEMCDPNGAASACNVGACQDGHCTGADDVVCVADADCLGRCQPAGEPTECTCLYGRSAVVTP